MDAVVPGIALFFLCSYTGILCRLIASSKRFFLCLFWLKKVLVFSWK